MTKAVNVTYYLQLSELTQYTSSHMHGTVLQSDVGRGTNLKIALTISAF